MKQVYEVYFRDPENINLHMTYMSSLGRYKNTALAE
jgi:hypothetical protein